MTHWTPVGGDMETNVSPLKHVIENDSVHVSLSFPLRQDPCDRESVYT